MCRCKSPGSPADGRFEADGVEDRPAVDRPPARRDWLAYGLSEAKHAAEQSKDPSTKVGACILRPDWTVAAKGWNGFARGVLDRPERLADRDEKYARTIHAELNAILSAREPLAGYTMFVWPFQPCAACAGPIIQVGIRRVVTVEGVSIPIRWQRSFDLAKDSFQEAGVEMLFHSWPGTLPLLN